MTLNGAIMQLVELSEHPMMPVIFKPLIQKVIETISELEENPEPHWISCSERPPKEEGFYLVTLGYKHGAETNIRYFKIENGKSYWSKWGNENITAWMPKPEPYNGVTE